MDMQTQSLDPQSKVAAGFTHEVQLVCKATGEVVARELVRNKVPLEGLTDFCNVLFKKGLVAEQLYVGLYSGDYTPTGDETAARLNELAGEVMGYAGAGRPQWIPGQAAAGGVDNAASLAVFDFSQEAQVRGVFVSTSPTKGGGEGKLYSVVKLPSVKKPSSEFELRVLSGFQFVSL